MTREQIALRIFASLIAKKSSDWDTSFQPIDRETLALKTKLESDEHKAERAFALADVFIAERDKVKAKVKK